jgi:O-antigen ligase
MTSTVQSYNGPRLLSAFIFLLSGIAAISLQEPLLLIIPFAWVLLPFVFNYTITQTEQLYWLLFITLPLSAELNITPQLGIDFPDELLLMLLTAVTCLKIIYQPKWFPYALLKHPLFLVLAAWFFWLIITCIYAAEPLLSF